MKIAVIGSGPNAILSSLHFYYLGASVVLFQRSPLGGNVRFLLEKNPEIEFSYNHKIYKVKEFWEKVLVPAIEILEQNRITRAGNILRVHKRFLDKTEVIENKSRIHDLFRVVFSINPEDSILKQVSDNPEIFKLLGENVVSSLHRPVESFEDFDIVIDARGLGLTPSPMGAGSSLALNELPLRDTAPIYYEKDFFKHEPKDEKHIIIAGEGKSLVLGMLKLQSWLYQNKENQITVITHKPLSALVSEDDVWFRSKLQEVIEYSLNNFEKDKFEFEKKIFEWRALEDYVRVKVEMPKEPSYKIKIFNGYDVTSIDRLLDREGLFVTIESPDFRIHQDVVNDLRTLPCDAIYVCKGYEQDSIFKLPSNEDGAYILRSDNLTNSMSDIKKIENEILSFFSRT